MVLHCSQRHLVVVSRRLRNHRRPPAQLRPVRAPGSRLHQVLLQAQRGRALPAAAAEAGLGLCHLGQVEGYVI